MFILKKGHQPGVYVPLRALFLVSHVFSPLVNYIFSLAIFYPTNYSFIHVLFSLINVLFYQAHYIFSNV